MQVIKVKRAPCTATRPEYWVAKTASGIKEKISVHADMPNLLDGHGGHPRDLGDLAAYRLALKLGWVGWLSYAEDSNYRYYVPVSNYLYVPNNSQKIPLISSQIS